MFNSQVSIYLFIFLLFFPCIPQLPTNDYEYKPQTQFIHYTHAHVFCFIMGSGMMMMSYSLLLLLFFFWFDVICFRSFLYHFIFSCSTDCSIVGVCFFALSLSLSLQVLVLMCVPVFIEPLHLFFFYFCQTTHYALSRPFL